MLQLLHIELWAEAGALPIELSDMPGKHHQPAVEYHPALVI
jgi:hypothetical protein